MAEQRIIPDYRAIVEQSPVGIVVYDRELCVVGCNASFAAMIDSSPDRIIGLKIEALRDQRHREAVRQALDGATVTYESPYQATTSDAWPWLRATFGPLRNGNGDVAGVVVMVTVHRTQNGAQPTAHATPFAEPQLGEMQHFGRIGSWTWDAQRDAVAGSSEFHRILGLGVDWEGASSRRYQALIHHEDRDECLSQLLLMGARRSTTSTRECRVVRPDGTVRWIVLRLQAAFADDGLVLSAWGMIQDVTERRLLQEQLRQAQKMEAMGQLAAGVAHDFNNLLTVVKIESEALEQEAAIPARVQESARSIGIAVDRASDLTRQLLAFSRKQLLRPQLIDLNDAILGAAPLLRRLIGADVELVTDLAPRLPLVLADPGQLAQVLVNLAVNARDAMPRGGRFSIATCVASISDARNEHDLPPGDYVVTVVADTGHGISEATRRQIFEPFFTTKAPGCGTGLGLSTVHGIMEQLGGRITVASEPGKGAVFTLFLLPQPTTPPR